MLNKFLVGITAVVMLVFCLSGAAVPAAPGQPATAAVEPGVPTLGQQESSPQQSYIGSDKCFTCHRKQAGSWAETKHAQAYLNLPEKYRSDSSCLQCHMTAFGETGGYVPGMPDDEAQALLNVGCEACHGPGALHEDAVKRWTLAEPAEEEKLLGEIKTTIQKTVTDSQCAACHTNQVHLAHPPYEGQPQIGGSGRGFISTTISPPPTADSYSVKTCAACHYPQYQSWRVGKHAGLADRLPVKYANDKECQECHRVSPDRLHWYTPASDPQAVVDQTGVGCESCHGSGLKHVLFNKQYIVGPQLGPELEQVARQLMREEKPAAACVQCHIRERHGEHAKFEKPEDTEK